MLDSRWWLIQHKIFTSDGCTASWNGFYNLLCDACRDHDQIYFLGEASGKSRLQADIDLYNHALASAHSSKLSWCEKQIVRAYAPVQFTGVRTFGQFNFGPGAKWGYGDVY